MSRVVSLSAMLLAVATVGACSNSSTSTAAQPPTTAPPLVGPSAPAASGSGSAPAVAHATDLKSAPVVSAGAPPPPTQLVIKDLVVGSGQAATAANTVQVQYVGSNYVDGKVFDSSWSRGQPASFPLNGVIPGFEQGIVGMKVGGRRELVIPPSLGYGAQGSPPAVGPNQTLVFVIDLIAVQ